MRNDARPIGEHAPASPLGGERETHGPQSDTVRSTDDPQPVGSAAVSPFQRDDAPIPSERPDSRDTVARGRESHIVNRPAEKREPDQPGDPVMPQNDATLNTKI
jgi:hypothetical protein